MAGWNDYANFTSPDKLRLTSPLDGILPLIKAINERNIVTGFTPIAEISRLDETSYLTGIQNRVTLLIKRFVNHLDNGGNWHGKSEIPNWTEAGILSTIGPPARIPAPIRFDELSADWLYQQYKIFNLLLWTKNQSQKLVDNTGYDGSSGGWTEPTVQEAVDFSIANKNPVAYHYLTNQTRASTYNFRPSIGTLYSGSATSMQGKLQFDSLDGDIFNSAGDVYFLARDINIDDAINDFDGAGIAIEGLNLAESAPVANYSSYTSQLIGNKEISPVYPVTRPNNFETSTLGWITYASYFISKFNVPGGFEFVEEFNT